MIKNRDLGLGMKGTFFFLFASRCSEIVNSELVKLGFSKELILMIEAVIFGVALTLII